ncbi:MAG: GNAT family N-acetyltransferase [Alistipes sp.]
MDLWPWACALYVEERLRGYAYGRLLLDRAAEDARRAGFGKLYLSTDHAGLYESGASVISDRAITRGGGVPDLRTCFITIY